MTHFMPDPKVHLHTSDDLINYLNNHPNNYPTGEHSQFYPPHNDDVNVTKSDFICDCVRELENSGKYSYNDSLWMLVREKLGLDEVDYHYWWDNQKKYPFSYKILYILVCNASSYKDSDDLVSKGFEPLNESMIKNAYEKKAKIQLANGTVYNVKMINEKVYVMPKYSRNRALSIQGQPAKIIVE
jgi:hypothetical protein